MVNEKKTDVIVIGAGPAGVSAAITVARGGKRVILIERGDFAGAKNMYGGVVYDHAAQEIFPEYKDSAPIERFVSSHNYMLMDNCQSTTIKYKNHTDNINAFITIRSKWDKWCVEQAIKEGVYFVPNTLVNSLISENGRIVGIKTDLEDYYADIVIIADGVNSLLARQIGLRNDIKPKHLALGVKEVIKLSEDIINQRFGLQGTDGAAYELVGGALSGMLALGFIYTNKNTVSLGIGVCLEDLKNKKISPNDLLEQIKKHPSVAELINGGELVEYSAHLIPEGGYNALPKLYTNGAMVIGDAAMLVNNVHFEGTNMAMISGKFAGETALEAFEKNDFSENMLCLYRKKLENSFILKDLRTYRGVIDILSQRTSSFLGYYPQKVCEFFGIFTTADGAEKREKFVKFTKDFFRKRSLSELYKDCVSAIKLVFGVLK